MDRTLGSGTTARVHLAVDLKTGEQVACKMYDLSCYGKFGRDALTQGMMKEAFLRCQLEHVSTPVSAYTRRLADIVQPHLSSFRRAYKSPSTLYVFEDLGTGGDLFSLIIRESIFSENGAKWMVRQILKGVAYMHEKGVVHRDLKPENILCAVWPSPQSRLVITDFGHAAIVGPHRMRGNVGTPEYQAP